MGKLSNRLVVSAAPPAGACWTTPRRCSAAAVAVASGAAKLLPSGHEARTLGLPPSLISATTPRSAPISPHCSSIQGAASPSRSLASVSCFHKTVSRTETRTSSAGFAGLAVAAALAANASLLAMIH